MIFEPNITISYGRTYTTEDPARIAVVGIGYADGFPRSLSSNVSFLLHGRRVPQVGRICMDMCMVDITRVPEAKVGDVVTVFGEDGGDSIELTSLANRLGTIPYELMCGITSASRASISNARTRPRSCSILSDSDLRRTGCSPQENFTQIHLDNTRCLR